jgi:potassium channel subfamily K
VAKWPHKLIDPRNSKLFDIQSTAMIFESGVSNGLPFLLKLAILSAFIAGALLWGMLVEGWTAVDSLYWMVATVTTVGYGDLTPMSSTNGMIFGMIFILIGIVFIFDIIAGMVETYCDSVQKAAVQKAETYAEGETAPAACPAKLKKSAIVLTVILITGTAFFANVENWSYVQALYWCVCTATTVGYGDLELTQQSSKGVSIGYIVISVVAFGNVIGELADKKMKARMAKQRAAIRNLRVTPEMLERMDQDEGPLEVDCGEFMAHCLAELDIISTAESRLFIDKFREIDVDDSGTLTLEDLQLAADSGLTARKEEIDAANRVAEIQSAKLEVEVEMKRQMRQRESVMQQEKLRIERQMAQMESKMQHMEDHMERIEGEGALTTNTNKPFTKVVC